MKPVPQRIIKRIQSKGLGWVFTPKDFLELGPRAVIDVALSRMSKDGYIRRIGHGLYDFPKYSKVLGRRAAPASEDIAAAIARKTGDAIYPTGAVAANLLGLSTQVPAQIAYLTTGPSRSYKVGKRSIELQHSPLSAALKISQGARLVLHALLYLGKNGVDDRVIHRLRDLIDIKDKQHLMRSIPALPSWLAPKIKAIAA